ncbi:MAG: cyclic nucleotide-binding domain-containing protein [Hyphomicrobiaceae bacterium]|nr:cyclic nucleotide-binding domain-containing protein [Hyphomicrobiaceae bacterium]
MLTTPTIQQMLNETPLFAGCSPDALVAIAQIAVERDCKRGEVVYSAGSEAVDMFILVRGMVSFTTDTGVGTLNVETLMKRHMVFGWAALVPEHPRRLGSAKCLEDSKLLVINGDALLDVLAAHPQSGFVVMKRLCSMIASTFIEKKR